MSIFTKIGGWIVKPLIKQEMGKIMQTWIQPILDLIKDLIQPQNGTKFLITIAGLGLLGYLKHSLISDPVTTIVIGLVIIAYYIVDTFSKGKKKKEDSQ